MKFVPERFDPESEYYNLPHSGDKGRHVHSFMSFGSGLRSCAGKSLAMFELKVLAAYFLSKYKYEVDPEQLNNENIKFAMYSQFSLKIKITDVLN